MKCLEAVRHLRNIWVHLNPGIFFSLTSLCLKQPTLFYRVPSVCELCVRKMLKTARDRLSQQEVCTHARYIKSTMRVSLASAVELFLGCGFKTPPQYQGCQACLFFCYEQYPTTEESLKFDEHMPPQFNSSCGNYSEL